MHIQRLHRRHLAYRNACHSESDKMRESEGDSEIIVGVNGVDVDLESYGEYGRNWSSNWSSLAVNVVALAVREGGSSGAKKAKMCEDGEEDSACGGIGKLSNTLEDERGCITREEYYKITSSAIWKGSRVLNTNVFSICGLGDETVMESKAGCLTRWECRSKPHNATETPANGSSSTDDQQLRVGDGVVGPLEQSTVGNEAPEGELPNRRARRRRVRCWHCGRRGHTREGCWHGQSREGNTAVVDERSEEQ
ncbi:hypothetical protein FGB62_42g32 [Gracilaria domingensis]|nr:hypothetical protein FGB62_42g32 [Gracilaria domingensis]